MIHCKRFRDILFQSECLKKKLDHEKLANFAWTIVLSGKASIGAGKEVVLMVYSFDITKAEVTAS